MSLGELCIRVLQYMLVGFSCLPMAAGKIMPACEDNGEAEQVAANKEIQLPSQLANAPATIATLAFSPLKP